MHLRCPDCDGRLPFDRPVCPNGHRFEVRDGVLMLLSARESGFFATRDDALITLRDKAGLRRDDYDFDGLPSSARHEPEWRARCGDLETIVEVAGPNTRHGKVATALDVGASNGWLSNNLARRGWDVTAVDLFIDEVDGLGAMRRYPRNWRAIQLDIERPERIDERFDLVVLNHGAHFLRDPIALLAALQQRVRPGGILIAVGLRFFRWPERRARQVNHIRHQTIALSGTDVLNLPSKGLLDFHDRDAVISLGLKLSPDKHHLRGNVAALINRYRPLHMHGTWRAPL